MLAMPETPPVSHSSLRMTSHTNTEKASVTKAR